MKQRRLPGERFLLLVRGALAMLLLVGTPARAGLFIGEAGPADEREPGSGYRPGDAGYWIGGAGGFLYDCWSDDDLPRADWGLFCRAYQSGVPLGDPVPITQSVGYTVFFPAGCFGPEGGVRLLWSGNGQLWFSRSDDNGSTWSDPLRIDHAPGSVVMTAEPRIACGAAEVYVAWKDSREGEQHVYFNRSLDSGQSWEASDARIDATDGEVAGYRYGPILAADSSGDVYAAWVKGSHLYARVSNDFGESWADEAQLDVLGVPDPASARPSIAADESGHVYVAWTSVFGQMYLNRSSDTGATWLDNEQRISDYQAVIAVAGTVATDGKGHVYGLWYYQAQGSFILDVRFSVSSDYGETWQDKDAMLGTTGVSLHPFIPHLAADASGNVYAVWMRYQSAGTVRHIYANASFDAGTTWQGGEEGFAIDSAPDDLDINAHEPFVGCDGTGLGGATWIDRRDPQQMHLFMNVFGQAPESAGLSGAKIQ